MAKRLTIEDLAVIVNKGFDGVQKQFEGVHKELVDIRNCMATKEDLEILAKAIKDLELHFSASASYKQEQIDHLRNWMESIEARVSAMEAKQSKKR